MAGIFMTDKVLYSCTCGSKRPIPRIYFCRHCLQLRCGDCVSHEVDSHYCPNCLEYMPTPEAKLKKNRCANCFDCPSCMHTLSTRATNVQIPSSEDPTKMVPKKVFYLVCGFCRWTSRDVGISDQSVATGCWPKPENENVKRINQLLEHYRAMAQQEKLDRERRKFTQRSGYPHYSDKFGISAVVARKLAGLSTSPGLPGSKEKDDETKNEEPAPAIATINFDKLPDTLLTQSLNLTTVSSIKQRLLQPEFQPSVTSNLYPRHKSLLIKKSQRCKVCEHNLSKPEYNPSSIKFKIQLTAFYHIVELRIKSLPALFYDEPARVEFTLCNPTPHQTHVSFLPLADENDTKLVNAEIELPKIEFVIPPRDDTAEFDELPETRLYQDQDPSVVSFQKGNKMGFFVNVTPKSTSGEVKIGLKMKHDFVNVVVQLQVDQRESQEVWLSHTVWINLGNVCTGPIAH